MSVALVTGGSRGIGRAIALRLAGDGYGIGVGFATQAEAADEVAEQVRLAGGRALAVGADLAEEAAAEQLVDEVESGLGPIDVLVANAGIATVPTPLYEITTDDWERVLRVNLRAPFLLTRRLLPGMMARGSGRIVFISSGAAYTGGLIGAHYASSKAGLHGLAHSVSRLAAGHGVTANVVAPALVESDMLPAEPAIREALAGQVPVGRLGQPEEVADLVATVVRTGYMTGQSILLDGGGHPT